MPVGVESCRTRVVGQGVRTGRGSARGHRIATTPSAIAPGSDIALLRRLRRRLFPLQILVEELENPAVAGDLILLLREPVSLVIEDDVHDGHAVLLHRLDDLVRLWLDD